ncbi:MAG: ATP-binding protein [Pseudomonadota bacterium]
MSVWATIKNQLILGSLRVKMICGVSIILFTVMGGFNYYDVVTHVARHTEENRRVALNLTDTVLKSIEFPMFRGDMDKVQAILQKLAMLEGVAVVDLCDDKGVVKYGVCRNDIGKKTSSETALEALRTGSLADGFETDRSDAELGKVLVHSIPIRNDQGCHKCHGSEKTVLGVLSVGFSWASAEESMNRERDGNIMMAVMSLTVLAFFLTLWLNRYITRPIEYLTTITDEISHGKYLVRPWEFPKRVIRCWEILNCGNISCPAYGNDEIPCWYAQRTLCAAHQRDSLFDMSRYWKTDGSEAAGQGSKAFQKKLKECSKCSVYQQHKGDEIIRLQDGFQHMLHKLYQYEEELGSSEEKYKLLFNANPSPIFIIDRDTFEILDVNDRAVDSYGHSRQELLKMDLFDLGSRPGGDVVSVLKALLPGQSEFISKKRHTRKNDEAFYITITACRVTYMGKEAWILATTDITESVEKEAQLIQAGKMATMGTMASGIAHELNQPLNVIKIGSDFLIKMIRRGEKIENEELQAIAEEMSNQIDRASGIINHLRDFSRVSAPVRSEININDPINDVFKILGQQLRLHQIDVNLELAEGLPAIMAEHNRLEQVFINLVTNAMDALDEKVQGMPFEGGEKSLTIKSFAEDGEVVVIVSDTGGGIPNSIKDKIFEPFFTTKKAGKGTGLGLCISFTIVGDYDGTIDVASEEGKGTTFVLRFPVHQKASENDHVNVTAD